MMIKEIIYNATKHLKQHGCDTPRLDAEVILTHVLKQNRAWLYIHSNDSIPEKACHQFQKYIHRRACREPVAYIIGTRAFFGLLFNVSSTVLIPRPETELLVETALQLIEQKKYTSIIDMGTGSGCIAISLAVNAQVKIIATDISSFALYMAKHNAICHQVMDKITFVQSDLLTGLTGNIDLLVTNPPYITTTEIETLAPEVKTYEPRMALNGFDNGVVIIEKILKQAPHIIKKGGTLIMEIESQQGEHVLSLAYEYASYADFTVKQDLAGHDRVLVGLF